MALSATHLLLLLAATAVSVCWAVLVGPVRLAHNKRYIDYLSGPSPENCTLECPVTLEGASEEVKQVNWVLWKNGMEAGGFHWLAGGGEATASGLLEGRVKMDLVVGSLELTKLAYDLNANYSCSVNLTNGDFAEAEQWELLIIDKTSNTVATYQEPNPGDCTFTFGFEANAVYPKPTPRSGMYSANLGGVYYDEVPAKEWKEKVYANGSVAYSFSYHVFQISQDTPQDTVLLSTTSVMKSDGTVIMVDIVKTMNHLWTKKGCPEVQLKENQKEEFWTGGHTCRNEKTSGTLSVVCEKGHHSDGEVHGLRFQCEPGFNGTYFWDPPLTTLGDLKCVRNRVGRVSASLLSLSLLLLSPLLLTRLLQ